MGTMTDPPCRARLRRFCPFTCAAAAWTSVSSTRIGPLRPAVGEIGARCRQAVTSVPKHLTQLALEEHGVRVQRVDTGTARGAGYSHPKCGDGVALGKCGKGLDLIPPPYQVDGERRQVPQRAPRSAVMAAIKSRRRCSGPAGSVPAGRCPWRIWQQLFGLLQGNLCAHHPPTSRFGWADWSGVFTTPSMIASGRGGIPGCRRSRG